MLSAFVGKRYFAGAQGSGIPQAIAARFIQDRPTLERLLSLRIAFGKIALTVLGLAVGASIGREGPTVQIGASILVWLSYRTGMGRQKGLILAGGAAGVAAAFNTPLAGVVFAIEEMSRSFERSISSLVLIAVILAGIAAVSIDRHRFLFRPDRCDPERLEGLVRRPGGGDRRRCRRRIVFADRALGLAQDAQPVRRLLRAGVRWPLPRCAGSESRSSGSPVTACPMAPAMARPRRRSTGIWSIPGCSSSRNSSSTLLSQMSGIPGGILSPSLSIGAGLGAALYHLMPGVSPGAVALLAMVGFFAGAVQAPITGFVIVAEMTGDHAMIIPLMATALVATGISKLITPEPLYHALAEDFRKRPEGGRPTTPIVASEQLN